MTEKEVSKTKAEENASVLITRSKGQQKIVVNEVKADTVSLVNTARAKAQTMMINTERQVAVMGIEASTENAKAKADYETLI